MYVIRNINIFWLQCVRVHVYMEGGGLNLSCSLRTMQQELRLEHLIACV